MSACILIVDDEPTITSALNYYFVQAGYKTILAHSGNEALEKLSLDPDLVILDIMLPLQTFIKTNTFQEPHTLSLLALQEQPLLVHTRF